MPDYSHPVRRLAMSGLQSRYMGGSGQGVTIHIDDLSDNLSYENIDGLQSAIARLNLPDGIHTVGFSGLGARFVKGERDTIGRFRANVAITVDVNRGRHSVVSGSWSQTAPDKYDFAPVWSDDRSLLGNFATVLGAGIAEIVPPFDPKPFDIQILGARPIDGNFRFLADPPTALLPVR